METEHCVYYGSQDDFEVIWNKQNIRTNPYKLWKGISEKTVKNRVSLDLSLKAGLKDFEVIALMLYTGPMVNEIYFL